MSEDVTTEPGSTEPGQATEGTQGAETTQMAPDGSEGQSREGTTTDGPPEDTFFDPRSVPEELSPAYKQMQAAFTKRMQGIASEREKIDAYNAFMSDPMSQLRTLAQQYGFQVVPNGQQPAEETTEDPGQPETWDQVYKTAEERAYQRIMGEIKPLLGEVQNMKATAIEKQLDDLDATWRQYEPQMKKLLGEIPALAKDPAKLYKMAVPDEVLMQRATQIALAKLEKKTSSGAISGGSTTTKHPAADLSGSGPRSFAESVAAAKKALAEQGVAPE